MYPVKENNLVGFQISKLFFVVPVWDMPDFHLLPFVISEQHVQVEMSRVVVFFYIIAFNFAPTIAPLGLCSA